MNNAMIVVTAFAVTSLSMSAQLGNVAYASSSIPPHAQRARVRPADPAEMTELAAREASAPQLEAYRGGDTVVVGASAVTLALAIVLLVLLL